MRSVRKGSTSTRCCSTSSTLSVIGGCGMPSATAGRLAGSRFCCRSPRPDTTARAFAGSSTPTPSVASRIRPPIQRSLAASTQHLLSADRTARGRRSESGTKPTRALARRSRSSLSRPMPARPRQARPSSIRSFGTGSTSGPRLMSAGSRLSVGEMLATA